MSFNEIKTSDRECPAETIPCAALAYLGDSVLEIMVRRHLVTMDTVFLDETGSRFHYSDIAKHYVTAVAQSEAVERILPHLTEDEEAVYKRGRNNIHTAPPKSASTGQYRRATGFECLLGYLYLENQNERLEELFKIAYPETNKKIPKEGSSEDSSL